jgi:hypothetical protein
MEDSVEIRLEKDAGQGKVEGVGLERNSGVGGGAKKRCERSGHGMGTPSTRSRCHLANSVADMAYTRDVGSLASGARVDGRAARS